jgi:hypothetical protein
MSAIRKRVIVWTVIGIGLMLLGITLYGPSSADIRIDTGDLRYRYGGIPLVVYRMPEPDRAELLELAKQSGFADSSWHQCAKYPLPTTNNTDAMCRMFYLRVAAWAREDQVIAGHLMENVVRYIRQTNARQGGPEGFVLLFWASDYADDGSLRLRDGWQEDEEVQAYLQSIDYPSSN